MDRVIGFLQQNEKRILWMIGIAIFFIVTALCFFKYTLFLYDGIDLAYFSQVFWNFAHGQAWMQSIHPHASLGDHAELIIPVLVPLYALWQDPRMLLLLQSAAVLLPAIFVYKIAKRHQGQNTLLPFFATLLYLLNPIVHNIALFEFHILAFALFPLFWALYSYLINDCRMFLLAAMLSMTIREDVALVVFGFSLLSFFDVKRDFFWKCIPAIMAISYFFCAMQLISTFAPAGNYKFLIYYSWLGNSFADIIIGIFRHPLTVLNHLFSIENVEMVIGFLMAAGFLPLFAGRQAFVAITLFLGPLAQILLGAPGGSSLIFRTHYATLFLPAVTYMAILGMVKIPTLHMFRDHRTAFLSVGATIILFCTFWIGPLNGAYALVTNEQHWEQRELFLISVSQIKRTDRVVASYRLLPHLANREHLYSLHYAFLGVTQFAERNYVLPPIDIAMIDPEDAERFQAQFSGNAWAAPYYKDGFSRITELLAHENVLTLGGSFVESQKNFDFLLGPMGTTMVREK